MKLNHTLLPTPYLIAGVISFAVASTFTSIVYFTRWAPLYEQQQSLLKQQHFYRQKIIEKNSYKNNVQTIENQKAKFAELTEKLQAPGEDATLLQHLERHARELNIVIKNFSNNTSKNEGRYIATYYSLNTVGPYKNTRTFLTRMGQLPHFVILEKVLLKPENKSANIKASLTLKKYHQPTTANGKNEN